MLYGKSVEHTQNQHSRDDHLEMQSKMCNLGVLDLVLQAFESEKLHPDMRSEVAELGYRLLEFGNESAQDKVLENLSSKQKSSLFEFVAGLMDTTVTQNEYLRNLSGEQEDDPEQRYQLMAMTFRFLQSMCEGHHTNMQVGATCTGGVFSVNF